MRASDRVAVFEGSVSLAEVRKDHSGFVRHFGTQAIGWKPGHVRLLSPSLGWLAPPNFGAGAEIVMKSTAHFCAFYLQETSGRAEQFELRTRVKSFTRAKFEA